MSSGQSMGDLNPLLQEIDADLAKKFDAPKFAQPWHAQAFGTSMALSRAGLFAWAEWVETFSAVIRNEPQCPDEDSNTAYYRQWETALETILLRTGLLSAQDIARAAEDWRRSYLNTQHGHPVEFRRDLAVADDHDDEDRDHHRHEHSRPEPIAVSPAQLAAPS